MDKLIKIGLSILLLLCLADMPYGYFQILRFVSLIGFVILGFDAYQKKNQIEVIIYIFLAILFQPLLKISFGRTLWNIIDFIVAIGLILSVFSLANRNKK